MAIEFVDKDPKKPKLPASAPKRSGGERLSFLDGLRGLAALQVVLLHYCAAFLPGLGTRNAALIRYPWESAWIKAPLFFIVDGTFAVYIFFVISGMVLTIAFERRPLAFPVAIGQRAIRLGGPMVIALIFSAALLALFPQAHSEAAALSGSADWLGRLMQAPSGLAEIVHQVVSGGMLVGYKETSLLPQVVLEALVPDPDYRSFDPPLWSLHVEFWGSVLMAGLAVMRHLLPTRAHLVLAIALALLLSRHAFLAFMVGHLFALARTSPRWGLMRGSPVLLCLGVISLVLGIYACTNPPWDWIKAWFAVPGPFRLYGAFHTQNLYAASVFFAGVMLIPALTSVLAAPPVRWLGRNSFGLYLLHFPILFTLASAILVKLNGPMPYGAAAFGSAAAGIALSLGAAVLFTAFVDQPFIRLSRKLANYATRLATRSSMLPEERRLQ